jgi:uncharacterized membrane protein
LGRLQFSYPASRRERIPGGLIYLTLCRECGPTAGGQSIFHGSSTQASASRGASAHSGDEDWDVRELERRSWKRLVAFQICGVLADVVSTREAIRAGGLEQNPLYARAGTGAGLAVRLGVGTGVIWVLNRLHRSSPRLARRLAVFAIALNAVAATNNAIIAASE